MRYDIDIVKSVCDCSHQLHVVDQRVAVLPGLLGVAAQGGRLDVLGPVQLTQRRGEQQRRVVHQRRLRL